MDLHEGDIVIVTEIVDKNWYRYAAVWVFRGDRILVLHVLQQFDHLHRTL
jgi:hypothetical protein